MTVVLGFVLGVFFGEIVSLLSLIVAALGAGIKWLRGLVNRALAYAWEKLP